MTAGRKRLILIGLAVLLLNLLRVASAVMPAVGTSDAAFAAPAPQAPDLAAVVVTVIKADLGAAPGLAVSLVGPVQTSDLTGPNGTVWLSALPVGTYAVSAVAQGYLAAQPQYVTVTPDAPVASAIVILTPVGGLQSPDPAPGQSRDEGATGDEQLIDIPPDRPGSTL